MTKEEAIKYLHQLYPNGWHCWLDEQRIEAIDMAVKALQEEPISEELNEEIDNYVKKNGYDGLDSIEEVKYIANHFANWQKEQDQSTIELARDIRYKENVEVKEVDINKEISQFIDANFEKATIGHKLSLRRVAKHFFELGLKTKGE